jgi:DNA-binding protein HU-beta
MTKEDLVNAIAQKTNIEKATIQKTLEAFMETVKDSMEEGENVYLRGFGSFIIKKRARKIGRNISKNTTIIIPAHSIPVFNPSVIFTSRIKNLKTGKLLKPSGERWPKDFKKSKGTDDDGPGFKSIKKAKK